MTTSQNMDWESDRTPLKRKISSVWEPIEDDCDMEYEIVSHDWNTSTAVAGRHEENGHVVAADDFFAMADVMDISDEAESIDREHGSFGIFDSMEHRHPKNFIISDCGRLNDTNLDAMDTENPRPTKKPKLELEVAELPKVPEIKTTQQAKKRPGNPRLWKTWKPPMHWPDFMGSYSFTTVHALMLLPEPTMGTFPRAIPTAHIESPLRRCLNASGGN
ncbi:hypothetical protein QBC37DRAFT_404290 [Rhypophila decipiens]|uniref:Uncharacterized protein n=1 Tax=Rhypophila decipiens TaxID=261697 RepID=A0AAN7B421_9PEZI|nr:hypothetical protein QBC37DRAFT_404290 [Rhypophila decipiens]